MLEMPVYASHYEYQIVEQEDTLLQRHDEQTIHSPHYILHFDVNRTLIFSDAVQQQSPEDVIVNGLADRLEFLWDGTLHRPTNYTNYVSITFYPIQSVRKSSNRSKKNKPPVFWTI